MDSVVQEKKVAPCCVVLVPGGRALRTPVNGVLSRTVADLLRQEQRHFVVDLHRLDDIDAAGIGELVSALTTVRQAGGTLRIARPSRLVQQLLRIAGLLSLFSPLSHGDAARHARPPSRALAQPL